MAIEVHGVHFSEGGTIIVPPPGTVVLGGDVPEGCEVTCTQVRREPGDTKRVLPAEFPVGSLGHVGVRLRTILLLRSREEGDEIVVWHETLPGEARGPWFTVAVDRFRWALAYRFLDLCANESSLGPDEIHELEMLREYMEERH